MKRTLVRALDHLHKQVGHLLERDLLRQIAVLAGHLQEPPAPRMAGAGE